MTCHTSHSQESVRPELKPQFSDPRDHVFLRQHSVRATALPEELTGKEVLIVRLLLPLSAALKGDARVWGNSTQSHNG